MHLLIVYIDLMTKIDVLLFIFLVIYVFTFLLK